MVGSVLLKGVTYWKSLGNTALEYVKVRAEDVLGLDHPWWQLHIFNSRFSGCDFVNGCSCKKCRSCMEDHWSKFLHTFSYAKRNSNHSELYRVSFGACSSFWRKGCSHFDSPSDMSAQKTSYSRQICSLHPKQQAPKVRLKFLHLCVRVCNN